MKTLDHSKIRNRSEIGVSFKNKFINKYYKNIISHYEELSDWEIGFLDSIIHTINIVGKELTTYQFNKLKEISEKYQ